MNECPPFCFFSISQYDQGDTPSFFTSFFLYRPFCGLSGLSLAVRDSRPNCWLIGWQRLRAVMSRRGATSTSPVLHLPARVRVSASHRQYIEPALGLDRILSSSGLYICIIQRDSLWRGAMVAESFCPLFITLTCIFLLFELQASLSAERVLKAFHHLLYCLF